MTEPLLRDTLLKVVEAHTASVREGTDSLVVLYCWRKAGSDNASFAATLNRLVDEGWVELLPGPDMRLRLRPQAFAALDAEMPPPAPQAAAEDKEDEAAWSGLDAAAAKAAGGPPQERLRAQVRDIYRVLGMSEGRPVSAGTLAKIWALEKRRGADLRLALDLLTADGDLLVTRGARTTFALTPVGATRLGA